MLGEIYYEEFIARMQTTDKCHISYDGLKDLFFQLLEEEEELGVVMVLNQSTIDQTLNNWAFYEDPEEFVESIGGSFDLLANHQSGECDDSVCEEDKVPPEDLDWNDNVEWVTGRSIIKTPHGALTYLAD